jgi:hypothetical protein
MTQSITIPKQVPQNSALSYDFLRKEGMSLIQQMAGTSWTDHNIHDPGITMLEQVCYAVTDLAYRMDYDIQDLLGTDNGSSYSDLYSAATILSINPVTLIDLRKIVLDVEGVKNAWVEKVAHRNRIVGIDGNEEQSLVPRGLYRVFLEKDSLIEITGSKVVSEVRSRLMACRGVCEDFDSITMLDDQQIKLQGVVEIADTIEDVNQMVAQMLLRVGSHLSPRIPFYTLQQQIEKGKRTEDIFDGPRLKRGFLDNYDLAKSKRKLDVQTSDVMKELMDEAGVLAIDTLTIATGSTSKKWLLPLDETKTPMLDIDATLEELSFTSKGLTVGIDKSLVKSIYHQKRGEGLTRITSPKQLDLFQPETEAQSLANYHTLQNQFPNNYGIGEMGLPDSAPESRKAKAKQLTAYLLFFEQTLANYFSQVSNFKQLMSFDGDNMSTYFNQSLLDCVPGASEVVASEEGYQAYLSEMTTDTPKSLLRKNKFLNHLLARFAEKFTGYGMILKDVSSNTEQADKQLIKDKAIFLQHYPTVSAERGKGYDYSKEHWNTTNVSGLEKRIALKLGISDFSRRNIGDGNTAGFHMVEHVMLRPSRIDPSQLAGAYLSKTAILQFEAVENSNNTRCILNPNNTFNVGGEIRIESNSDFNGTYTVMKTGTNFIEINTPFKDTTKNGHVRRSADLRYFIRTARIESFSAGLSSSTRTFCSAKGHNLQLGNSIEVTQSSKYKGIYEVVTATDEGFEIEKTFSVNETNARWMPIEVPNDPYSLQLSFFLPNWIERYQNEDFKKFIALTVREETPAHMRVNIKWLNQIEMQKIDRTFKAFLEANNRS